MKKKLILIAIAVVAVLATVLGLVFGLRSCGNEPVAPVETTQPVTEETTQPEEDDWDDDDFTEEIEVIEAGVMGMHPNGKNGDLGIYFTMEENDIPADTTWATEYRPRSLKAIQLYRDGEVYDIGNTMTGMIIKYSATEYYLKLEQWNIQQYFPITSGDVLKIDGVFGNSTEEVEFRISCSYIAVEEGMVFFSTEYPTGSKVNSVSAGAMQSHPNGKVDAGIYFTMEPNRIPADSSWATEYKPISQDAVQLIRNGQTYNIANTAAGMVLKYSDTEYFLKLEQWIIKDFYPIQDGDILRISGKFANSATATVFSISQSYVACASGLLFFSTEFPENVGVEVIEAGTMTSHPKGRNSDIGFYFSLAENDIPLPADDPWAVEYKAASADCIQLIRDGKTYNIANTAAGQIIKHEATGYYLKLDQWLIKDYFPITDGDILVVQGQFSNTGTATVFNISKSYIAFADGLLFFSTEFPEEIEVEVLQAGAMTSHPNGRNGNDGFYFALADNTLPVDTTWATEYVPESSAVIRLIRDGETYDIGNTAAGTLIKYGQNDYYLKLQQWMLPNYFPVADGDILVVEGRFVNAGLGLIFEIDKTYVNFTAGLVKFSTEYPSEEDTVEVLKVGPMTQHPNGRAGDTGLYFSMAENDIPVPTDDPWAVEYKATDAGCIQLIRDGCVYNIGNTAAGQIIKYEKDGYYLKLEQWIIGELFPIADGDVLVVRGNFAHTGVQTVFEIETTYITYEDGEAIFSTEAPAEIPGGHMYAHHTNGWNTNGNNGLYFSLAENAVPVPEEDPWAVEYTPTSLTAVKLVRDGQTHNVAVPGQGTIVKFGKLDYYLKLEDYLLEGFAPVVPGDQLILEGQFLNGESGVYFRIAKTVITVGEDYALTFEALPATQPEVLQAGAMLSHTDGLSTTGNRLNFTLAENDLPLTADMQLPYAPVLKNTVQLYRGGVMHKIGSSQLTVNKKNATEYTLNTSSAALGALYPIQSGDILIVDGDFADYTGDFDPYTGTYFNIEKTYILVGADGALTYTQDDPFNIAAGMMASHPNGWRGSEGLYFTLAENIAPYDDWNVIYTPEAAENIKLIRDGVTYDVGHTQRETLVKFSDTEYYFAFWVLDTYKPVKAGDVIIVEGAFSNKSNGTTMHIDKTYITFNADGTALFGDELQEPPAEPDTTQPEETQPEDGAIQGGVMGSHTSGWTASGGLYFTLEENTASFVTDWSTRFKPESTAVIKLTRGNNTYEVANVAAEMLCKFSATEYYIEFWPITYKPMQAGDILTVEGNFINAANGEVLNISLSQITLNADGSATFPEVEEEPTQPEETQPEDDAIQGGVMGSHTSGWTASGGLYFTLEENAASFVTDWSTRFKPASNAVIKLTRGNNTYEVANVAAEMLCKFSATEYYMEFWPITYKPMQAGDILTVEGNFINEANGEVLNISLSQITLNADGSATFPEVEQEPTQPEETEPETTEPETTQPEVDPGMAGVIQAGVMGSHNTGLTSTFLFFTMTANDIPYHVTKAMYKPETADTIQLVRDGVTYDIADPQTDTVYKYGSTNYKLKLASLTMAPQDGDLLMVNGKFTGGNTNTDVTVTFYISKTFVVIADGEATLLTEDPRE